MLDLLLINHNRCKKKMLQILILKKSRAQNFQPGPSARTLAFIPDCNFGFRKYWDGCIFVEKTKVLISSWSAPLFSHIYAINRFSRSLRFTYIDFSQTGKQQLMWKWSILQLTYYVFMPPCPYQLCPVKSKVQAHGRIHRGIAGADPLAIYIVW